MASYEIPHFGLARQYANLKDELLDATDRAMREGILVGGQYTAEFEAWLKEKTGCRFAITVHSGTQALEILARYEAGRFRDFFEDQPTVLIPNITYPATLHAFLTAGYKVQLVDTDKNGLILMDESTFKKFMSGAAYYMCIVGLYGANLHASLGFIEDFSIDRCNLFVDGAQHWLIEKSKHTGIGMAISFDPTKNLPSSGNGGAIVTNEHDVYSFATAYKNIGKARVPLSGIPCTNSKMSEQDCAQILVRAKYIDAWQKRRKQIREHYIDRLKDLPIRMLSEGFKEHADQKFVIYTEHRDELLRFLQSRSIETKIHYEKALSQLPISYDLIKPDILSTSVMLTRGLLSLPIYPELEDVEVTYIIEKVREFFT